MKKLVLIELINGTLHTTEAEEEEWLPNPKKEGYAYVLVKIEGDKLTVSIDPK